MTVTVIVIGVLAVLAIYQATHAGLSILQIAKTSRMTAIQSFVA